MKFWNNIPKTSLTKTTIGQTRSFSGWYGYKMDIPRSNITPIFNWSENKWPFPWGSNPKKTHVFFKQPFPNTTKSPTAPTAAAKGHLKLRSQTKSWRVFGKGRRFVSCQPNQHIKAWAIWVLNLKWWVLPQIIHFNRVFRYKPSILGYHYFRKHPISE